MKLIYNGKLINQDEFKIGFDNRAFTYGDGVFETIIASCDKVKFLPDHLLRLSGGTKALSLNTPEDLNEEYLEKNIQLLIKENNIQKDARVKISVWRKAGGLFSATETEAEYLITAFPQTQLPAEKLKALFYKELRMYYSPISGFKTLSSLPYVVAGIAKKSSEADGLILFDLHDHIAECLVSNIFWIKEDKIFTPSTVTGCKDGIMRKQILNYLHKNNYAYEIGKFKEDALLNADFVFTSNVTGLTPIREIEGMRYAATSAMFESIKGELNKDL